MRWASNRANVVVPYNALNDEVQGSVVLTQQ